MKHHPVLDKHLEGSKRVTYRARTNTKDGLNCLPKMTFPGGLLTGCDAGELGLRRAEDRGLRGGRG